MKKQIHFVLAIAVALVVGLTACVKEDPSSPLVIDTTATAWVKGYVSYHPDLTVTPSARYPSASDVTITATVTYASASSYAQSGSFVVTATYDVNTGLYTVAVPATNSGTSVTIAFSSFSGSQKADATTTLRGMFTPAANITATVVAGQTYSAASTNMAYSFVESPVQ